MTDIEIVLYSVLGAVLLLGLAMGLVAIAPKDFF